MPLVLRAIDSELLLKDGEFRVWTNDGEMLTTVIIFHIRIRGYIIVSSDEEQLLQCLRQVVDWKDGPGFNIPAKFSHLIKEQAKVHAPGLKKVMDFECDPYCVTENTWKNIPLPPGYMLDDIKLSGVEEIDTRLEYRLEGITLPYIQREIQQLPSVGVRDSSGKLVAHEMLSPFLHNVNLYVHPEHRNKD